MLKFTEKYLLKRTLLVSTAFLFLLACRNQNESKTSAKSSQQEKITQKANYFPILSDLEIEKNAEKACEYSGLVRIHDIDPTFILDLKYATTDNFTETKLYPYSLALLQKSTCVKLAKVNQKFRREFGYTIKIWDPYRPFHVQKLLYERASNKLYVADPNKGSGHNRGAAIDMTLVKMNGEELKMPSEFDHFSILAHRDYSGPDSTIKKNIVLFSKVMQEGGFIPFSGEWWHFEDKDRLKYDFLDIHFEEFEKKCPK